MKIDRSLPPTHASEIKFNLPTIQQFITEGGLQVTFVEKENLPIIQMNLITNAGSKNDPVNRFGLSYLTSLLIDEGAGEFSALELDNEIESLGSIFSVSTDSDLVHLNMLSMEDKFPRSVELLSKIYFSPLFQKEDFDREKKKLKLKIVRNSDDPSYIASKLFKKQIFNSSQYAHPIIGENSEVEAITNEEVIEFYNQNFHLSDSHLIVVGNISQNRLSDKLNKFFQTSIEKKSNNFSLQRPEKLSNQIFFVHKDGASQSEIRVGHLSNSRQEKDYFSKVILNSILGGQFSSRLNLNLREDKGFTYGVSSGFYYNKSVGHFQIATSVQGENTGKALEEIDKEISGIREKISQEEIDFSKSYLIKRFPSMFETYSQIANNLTSMIHHDLGLNYYNDYIDRINECTIDDVFTSAQERIIPDDLTYLIVGDRGTVLPQLKSLFGDNVIELNNSGEIIS